jgi:hypothetical protein
MEVTEVTRKLDAIRAAELERSRVIDDLATKRAALLVELGCVPLDSRRRWWQVTTADSKLPFLCQPNTAVQVMRAYLRSLLPAQGTDDDAA